MSSMWPKGWVAVGIALLGVILLGSLPASAQSTDGVVRGQVANWTESGGPVDQVVVTLDTFRGTSYLGSVEATTGGNGTFEFTGLDMDAELVYQVSLVYQEAYYSFDWFSFEEGVAEKTVNLVVYDSTSDSQIVAVGLAHVILNIGPETIEVTEFYRFTNDSDKTYVGSEGAGTGARKTLEFALPERADEVGLQLVAGLTEWSVALTPEGFADTAAVFPGTRDVQFAYSLDYASDSYSLPLTFVYPVASFDLMVGGQYADILCDELELSAPLGSGSDEFTRLTGAALERGMTLDVQLSGLQGPSGLPPVAIAAIIMAHMAVIGFVVLRRRRRRAAIPVVSEMDEIASERRSLVQELAALDDSYERGDIPEDDYLRLRDEKKEQLIRLMRRRSS